MFWYFLVTNFLINPPMNKIKLFFLINAPFLIPNILMSREPKSYLYYRTSSVCVRFTTYLMEAASNVYLLVYHTFIYLFRVIICYIQNKIIKLIHLNSIWIILLESKEKGISVHHKSCDVGQEIKSG